MMIKAQTRVTSRPLHHVVYNVTTGRRMFADVSAQMYVLFFVVVVLLLLFFLFVLLLLLLLFLSES